MKSMCLFFALIPLCHRKNSSLSRLYSVVKLSDASETCSMSMYMYGRIADGKIGKQRVSWMTHASIRVCIKCSVFQAF